MDRITAIEEAEIFLDEYEEAEVDDPALVLAVHVIKNLLEVISAAY